MRTVEVTRTYLEMRSPAELRGGGVAAPAGARLEPVEWVPASLWRYLYREVGGPYHWLDRREWNDDQIREYLSQPITLWLLTSGGAPAGYFELKRNEDDSIEIAYFGLLPDFVGKGLGKYLLVRAIEEAWAQKPSRVWLHTCTLDHPAALPNYLERGFTATGTESYRYQIPD
ncbi:MAG TPA: GNAT family N-acetyltransferase [Gemmatimonadales bacterium]|nr:GNAT family N-acetyltransferase [Gemmatimonadales bacterium]